MLPPLINSLGADELRRRAEARRLRGVFRVSNDAYHSGPGISSTGLKRLLVSPAHFKVQTESTRAMAFGTALHMAVLEPELFAATYVKGPENAPRNTKEGKAKWADFEATLRPGAQVLTAKEWEDLAGMVRSVGRSDVFRGLVRGSECELSAYHICPDTGVLRKARGDIVADGMIADVKTCQSSHPNDFARTVHDFGFHISAAYYLDVFGAALGVKIDTFILIAVEKSPPFGVRFYAMPPRMLEIGRAEYRRALALYRECAQRDEWPAYADEVEVIEFPDYIYRRYP